MRSPPCSDGGNGALDVFGQRVDEATLVGPHHLVGHPGDDALGAFPGDGVAQGMAAQGLEDEDVEPQAAQLRPEAPFDQANAIRS